MSTNSIIPIIRVERQKDVSKDSSKLGKEEVGTFVIKSLMDIMSLTSRSLLTITLRWKRLVN